MRLEGFPRFTCQTASFGVIPGWSEGPDPESRDSGFAVAPRNDNTRPHCRGAECARVMHVHSPRIKKRAQGMPVPQCTRSLVRKNGKHTSKSTTGPPERSGTPCAMVLTVSFVISLVSRAFLPPSRVRCASIVTHLTPASGRQDHTTSPSAKVPLVSSAQPRPPHPAPTSVTIAKRPSFEGAGRRRLWI